MRNTRGEVAIHLREKCLFFPRETAQHRIHQAGGTLLLQDARAIDGGVHSGMRRVTRVFDLMSRASEQRAHFRCQPFRPFEQRLDRRRKAQIPADGSERDRANRRAIRRARSSRW